MQNNIGDKLVVKSDLTPRETGIENIEDYYGETVTIKTAVVIDTATGEEQYNVIENDWAWSSDWFE